VSPPRKKKDESAADAQPWMVWRICDCTACRDVPGAGACELRGGWFFGPGAKEREGQRPYWMTRQPASWRMNKGNGS
jgi:hypothetical protein